MKDSKDIIQELANMGIKASIIAASDTPRQKEGILIESGSSIQPILYIDQIETIDRDQLLDLVKEALCKSEGSLFQDVINNLMSLSLEEAVPKLSLWVEPVNEAKMKHYVHTSFLDLIVYPVFHVDLPDREVGSIRVTWNMLDQYQITAKELVDLVLDHIQNNYNNYYDMIPWSNFLGTDNGSLMTVVTSKNKDHGASAILCKNLLAEFAETLGEDITILPSSIHEVILIPRSVMTDVDACEMVSSINHSQVAENERLADHAYVYMAQSRCICSLGEGHEVA